LGEFARSVTPELLDDLPAHDPRAIASRQDLQRINFVMRHRALMTRCLITYPPPRVIIDLGSGDGLFLLGVAKQLAPHWRNVRVLIADQRDLVSGTTRDNFAAIGWSCESLVGDVFDSLAKLNDKVDIVTANLFLHHFDAPSLTRLLLAVKEHSRGFVACEPRRSLASLMAGRLVFALGCNDVTRHDAVASVRAGFLNKELSALWQQDERWTLDEKSAMPFSHIFAAKKHDD